MQNSINYMRKELATRGKLLGPEQVETVLNAFADALEAFGARQGTLDTGDACGIYMLLTEEGEETNDYYVAVVDFVPEGEEMN